MNILILIEIDPNVYSLKCVFIEILQHWLLSVTIDV